MPSIRRKITIGYYLLAASIMSLAIFAYVDLRFLEDRIDSGVIVSSFLDTTLEMRRFEKNYFLYDVEADYLAARAFALKADELLRDNHSVFEMVTEPVLLELLKTQITSYQKLFDQYTDTPINQKESRIRHEAAIREAGRSISSGAEQIEKSERALLRASVNQSRSALVIWVSMVALLGIFIGHLLSRTVVRPLRRLEADLHAIGEGKYDQLRARSNDQEIVSFTKAFNHMLHELELRRRHLMQTEKLASLGTLVSGVAHELNNPLSNISSSCQLLIEDLEAADKDQLREWLEEIDEQTERARNIVRTLLDFSRDRLFKKEPVKLKQTVDKALLLLRSQLPKSVTTEIEIPNDLVLSADNQKLQQVFVNILKNAVEAGGPEIHISISAKTLQPGEPRQLPAEHLYGHAACSSDETGKAVMITLADNGPGIPEEIVSRIFDPFFTTKEVGYGSGLGLSIAQEIIDQHGGCIGVASTPGKGTHFVIMLPCDNQENTA